MLSNVTALHQTQLTGLAHSWLASGAQAYSIWENGRLLASWPSAVIPATYSLSAEIKIGGRKIGELKVKAPYTLANQIRLEAEANLLASLVALDLDLSGMTSLMVGANDQLLSLYQMMRALPSDMRLESTLEHVAREVAKQIKASGVFVFVRIPGREEYWGEYGQVSHDRRWLYRCIERLDAEGLPILHFEHGLPGPSAGINHLLLLSIPSRGAARSVLGMINRDGNGFTAADQKLAKAVAGYAGLQIEHAILSQAQAAGTKLEMELELAHLVQTSLLPNQTPGVAGLDVFAMTQPASRVGGDFYDFISKPDSPFTFTVCDISGKGVPAALMVAMTRMVIRTFAGSQPVPTPAAVVSTSNAELYEDFTQVNMLATMFVGQYEPAERVLHYANAGHAPVVYYSNNGGPRLLVADGTALGVMPTSYSCDQQLKLDPGDVLVVGTDGLSEVRNGRGEMFGYNVLLQLVATMAERSAREIAESLREAVGTFAQSGPLEDDQTLVVCKGV